MSKILILGIGNAQADAIEYCQRLGVEVHARDFTECGVGRGLVDHFSAIDIVNIDDVCQFGSHL